MKKAAILSVLLIIPLVSGAQDTAASIMEKSRQVMQVESFEAVSRLIITDPEGRVRERTNVTASKSYDDGTEKRLIKFISPADIEGTAILIYDYEEKRDDMWIYLPALDRTRRIASSEKSRSFMGSEFTNADMSSPPTEDFEHRIVEETADNYIIESIPLNREKEDEYGYARKLSTIGRDNYLVSKMDFYNARDEHFKTIVIKDVKEVEGSRFIISHMTAENFSNGRSSEIIMDEIRTGTAIRDEMFNVSNLGR